MVRGRWRPSWARWLRQDGPGGPGGSGRTSARADSPTMLIEARPGKAWASPDPATTAAAATAAPATNAEDAQSRAARPEEPAVDGTDDIDRAPRAGIAGALGLTATRGATNALTRTSCLLARATAIAGRSGKSASAGAEQVFLHRRFAAGALPRVAPRRCGPDGSRDRAACEVWEHVACGVGGVPS